MNTFSLSPSLDIFGHVAAWQQDLAQFAGVQAYAFFLLTADFEAIEETDFDHGAT